MMEETERDCLLFALYATVGEVIEQVPVECSFSTRHIDDLTDNIANILRHGCSVQVTQDTVDYWPFIEGLQTLQPCLCGIIDRFSRKPFDSNNERCLAWIRYSLQEQALQSHLAILVANQDHVKRNYNEHAFLKSRHHMSALRDCLKALDQKNMDLLPDLVDFTNIGVSEYSPSSLPSPTDDPPVSVHNGYDSGVECVPLESKEVAMKQPRTVEFGQMHGLSSVSPSSAVANFDKTRRSSFHGLSSLGGDEHDKVSGAQGLLQKLQQDERKARSLTTTPELQKHVLSEGGDNDAELQTLSPVDDYAQARSFESNVSVRSEDSFVVVASHRMTTHSPVHVSKETVDGIGSAATQAELMSNKKDRSESTVSQQDEGAMSRRNQEYKARALTAVNRVSLLDTMGSPRLFASENLEKDNAHFAVADILIAAVEEVNAIHMESYYFASSSDQVRQFVRLRNRRRSDSVSNHSDEAAGDRRKNESEDEEFELSGSWIDKEENEKQEIKDHLSSSMASLYANSDFISKLLLPRRVTLPVNNADDSVPTAGAVASRMLNLFSPDCVPPQSRLSRMINRKDDKDLRFLVASEASLTGSKEETSKWADPSRMRGNRDWAPPRAQIIFNIHLPLKRKVIVERQEYRCAGCGLEINSQHIKFFRYCEYMGRYFCSSCHGNKVHIIPSRVLHKWDFRPYPVSNFAYELLSGIFYDPVFNVASINRDIIHKVKELRAAAQLRRQLFHLKDFIRVCRLSDSLSPDFQQLGYLVSDPEWTLYSLNDLTVLRRGGLISQLKNLLLRGLKHVDGCQLCNARGFVCEVCNNGQDVIFPFQVTKSVQCPRCRNCFHRVCFDKVKGHCKRCERVRARKKVGPAVKNTPPL